MDAEPSRPPPAVTPAGPLARLERCYAALLRLVGPNGRPVRKALLLAPALFLFGLPLNLLLTLLSVASGAPVPSESASPTLDWIFGTTMASPILETWLVIGLYCGATAPDRMAPGVMRHAGVARLLGALFTGAVMAALHTPYSPARLASVGVFFATQALQYEAWRRHYRFWPSYVALAGTHCVNNLIATGGLLLLQLLG